MTPDTFAATFQAATQWHQSGELQQAEAAYRQVLSLKPDQPDVLHLLGILYYQTGHLEEAVALISQAIQINPKQAAFHSNLGAVFQALGKLEEAISQYTHAAALQPDHLQALFNLGLCHFQLGQYDQAEHYYQQALALQPQDPHILTDLAHIYRQRGWFSTAIEHLELALQAEFTPDRARQLADLYRDSEQFESAIALYQQLIQQNPEQAALYNGLGLTLAQQGNLEEAVVAFRKALTLDPFLVEAHLNLGTALLDQEEPTAAIEAYQAALALQPDRPRTYFNLATAFRKLKEPERALDYYHVAIGLQPSYAEAYRGLAGFLSDREFRKTFPTGMLDSMSHLTRALGWRPDYAEAYFESGCLLLDQMQFKAAISLFEAALEHKPDFALAYNNMGIAYRHLNEPEKEEIQYRQALVHDPELGEAYSNLGLMLQNQRRHAEAVPVLQEAIRLKPDFLDAHRALGSAYKDLNRLAESVESFERALEINPEDPSTYAGLAGTLLQQCRHDEAIKAYRKSAKLAPGVIAFHGNILMGLHYAPDFDPDETYREHKKWGDAYQASVAQYRRPYHRDRDMKRPLNIGYISGDFKLHSVSLFFEHVYNHHDHEQFKIHCYSNGPTSDAVTERMREKADVWHDISKTSSDFEVATLIHEDKIDILVDLAGHTGYNRLNVLALKPAPIQATYLGYPDTTGLSLVDYRITDAYADPPGMTERYHTEKLIRLPKSFLCYNPIDAFPPVSELPALATGYITFGCCNNATKITPNVVEVWAEILKRLPTARLLLKNMRYTDRSVCEIFWERFERCGVERERVHLVGDRQGFLEHFQVYSEVDIGLDPFPYNGTTTTCETLWGGVPVVVLAGNAHVCRVGVSILTNVGLPELIGQTREEYVEIAVRLAEDLPRLRDLRHNLRSMMEASPLRDPQAHARALERAYRQMWKALVVSGQ
ncbi:tetratricopeptide repeat protein [Thermostichus vulcanus]|uniref:protein O-GlcNAc transferase n=1 Tax=Thermostichus vulcanus str. 'Rupite' TaxID=2813851 RepID=A0ABT0C9B7_THEVL|nr:tetratricopeptide repeat protein [Thermostichus vulcanus str. 'Rupite']